MENRNQYNSPRDRIDDALLIRLLNEEEPMSEYTCTGERRTDHSSCSDNARNRSGSRRSNRGNNSRRDDSDNSRCGHGDSNYTRERRDNSDNSRCGCGDSSYTRERRDDSDNSRCGCGDSSYTRERRNDSDNSRCGCGDSSYTRERRDNSDNSRCGCRSNTRERNYSDSARERREDSDDGCGETCSKGGSLSGYHLAMMYSPDQEWHEMYSEEEALEHGTLFRELDLPFHHVKCNGSCK